MTIPPDPKDLSDHWWVILLRGLASILFAVLACASPAGTVLALVVVFGAYAMIDGALTLSMSYCAAKQGPAWWPHILEGLVGIGAGGLAIIWPGMTALALLFIISGWAIVSGLLEIIAAFELRSLGSSAWLLGLGGTFSITFGVLVSMRPHAGVLAAVSIVGAYTLVFGVTLVALAFRVRGISSSLQTARV